MVDPATTQFEVGGEMGVNPVTIQGNWGRYCPLYPFFNVDNSDAASGKGRNPRSMYFLMNYLKFAQALVPTNNHPLRSDPDLANQFRESVVLRTGRQEQ